VGLYNQVAGETLWINRGKSDESLHNEVAHAGGYRKSAGIGRTGVARAIAMQLCVLWVVSCIHVDQGHPNVMHCAEGEGSHEQIMLRRVP
jgi:hypothetical protein